jgi:transposase
MADPTCPGCRERDALVAALLERTRALEERVRDLEARLGQNATNSSLPPSANPLGAPKPVVKPKSRRRPGGQPGHPPRLKQLLPAERVQATFQFVPRQCRRCQAPLPPQAGPDDPPPTRHQVIDLPPVVATVTEYQGHARTCPGCGALTHEPIPRELLAHSVGPRLTATLSYLTGCHGVSKRGVEEIAADIFDAPLALGTVANLEQEVSAALAAPHQEAAAAVQAAAVKHADETSWQRRGRLCWLWGAATAGVAVFVIHAKRGALGLAALLGVTIQGILCSDRWGVYAQVPAARRQVCWAHLKRDFRKVVDGQGPSAWVGRRGLRLVKRVFAAWHEFQEGRITRAQLQARLDPVEGRLNRVLLEGALLGEDAKVAAFCEKVLALEPALWTFARVEGVEPTNNFMERLLRRAVLWRKRSFGCWSAAGCRFVERILTVVQTRRLQGQSVLGYLHDALRAHRAGQPCPSLLPAG